MLCTTIGLLQNLLQFAHYLFYKQHIVPINCLTQNNKVRKKEIEEGVRESL